MSHELDGKELLTDLYECNAQGDDETGQKPKKAIGLFKQKDTHKNGEQGSALPDAGSITYLCDLKSETVRNVGEEKENPTQKHSVRIMSVAMQCTAPDAAV